MQSYDHQVYYPPHRYSSVQVASTRPPQVPPRPRHASIPSDPSPPSPNVPSSMPRPSVPASLTPGRQRPRPNWDPHLMASPIGPPTPVHFSPGGRMSLYGDFYFSQPPPPLPPPPLPQKPPSFVNPRPPVPPKPTTLISPSSSRNPLYPQSIPVNAAPSPSVPSPGEPRSQLPIDEKDIALAIALSASEAAHREGELAAQEEEDLARALEESRLFAESFSDFPSLTQMVRVGPPKYTRATPSPTPAEGESWLHMVTPSTSQHSEDSTIDEPLQEKQVEEITSLPRSSMRPANELLRHTTDPQSISHDSTSVPSLYSSVVSHIVAKPSPSISSSPSVSTAHAPYSPTLLSTSSLSYVSCEPMTSPEPTVELSSASPTQLNSGTQVSPPLVSRSSYITSNTTLDSIPSLTKSPAAPASPNLSLESGSSLSNILNEEEEDDDDPSMSSSAAPSATRYVEPELLLGVSLGFQLPVISTVLTPMQGPMPNVITLPYGKPPVLFFQAPSWRRLLKLMARLSGTQIEATLEAMAVAKHDLKLRTVIQFVKVHHSSPEWRTVLYFTTDMPIPPNVRSQHKYTNGDVTVLPFSYTLSALPPLLRDGAESPMAKYYVVPSTPTTPYPVLPINFPNLAMYLQSAVQDSRRAINDGSSGMRKLAHYIDTCYPSDYEGTATLDNEVPRRGVGGMLRRVIGRSRGPRGSRGNEEIYDLVTPFVADEWG